MSDAEDGGRDGPGTDGGLDPDPEKAAFLREVAGEIRGESSGSEQLAAIVYRLSDLYDETEETTSEDIYRATRHITKVKARGTLARDRD
jgi:hypothetical protein